MYRYVGNNSINRYDPIGLWSITLGAAWGYGGVVTFGSQEGTSFFEITGGVGVGAVAGFNPLGGPSPHLQLSGDETGAIAGGFGGQASAGIGVGPLGASIGYSGYAIFVGVQSSSGYFTGGGNCGSPGLMYHFSTGGLGLSPSTSGFGFSIYAMGPFHVGASWR